jgi:hypothetical protein
MRLIVTIPCDKERFSFFVAPPQGDSCVAPVRETAAQALAFLCAWLALNPSGADQSRSAAVLSVGGICKALQRLVGAAAWEARLGGLLGLKYIAAALASKMNVAAWGALQAESALLDCVSACLNDKYDEIRTAAAETIGLLLWASPLSRPDAQLPHSQAVVQAAVAERVYRGLELCRADNLSSSAKHLLQLALRLLDAAGLASASLGLGAASNVLTNFTTHFFWRPVSAVSICSDILLACGYSLL